VLGECIAELGGVVEEDVHPDPRIRAGDAGHLAKRRARSREWIVPFDRCGAHLVQEEVRERVRQVADEREEPVVRVGIDRDGNGTERADEGVQLAVTRRVGRRVRRQEPGRAVEEVGTRTLRPAHLRPGHRMAADKPRIGDRAGQRCLGRADVRDGRLGRGRKRGLGGIGEERDRDRDDDEVGVGGGRFGRRRGRHCPALCGRGEHPRVRVPAAHVCQPRPPRGERDRRADQTGADDGDSHSGSFAATLRLMSPAPRSEPWSWRSERGGSLLG
jgi:hypothetical protein